DRARSWSIRGWWVAQGHLRRFRPVPPIPCRLLVRMRGGYEYEDGGPMAGGGGRGPFQITLRASERRWLKALTRRGTAQHRQVLRAEIVLLAAAGWTNAGIARKLGLAVNH